MMSVLKVFLIYLSLFLLITPSVALSQTRETFDKVKELKEKVASKVAELRQIKSFVLSGKVKSKEKESFILITEDGEKKISVDNDTKYFWINILGKKLNINYSNLEVNDDFAVLAFGDAENDLTASIAIGKLNNFAIMGKIVQEPVDKKLKLILIDKNTELSIIIKTSTEISHLAKDGRKIKSKISDLTKKSPLLIRGNYDEDSSKEISAQRMLIF